MRPGEFRLTYSIKDGLDPPTFPSIVAKEGDCFEGAFALPLKYICRFTDSNLIADLRDTTYIIEPVCPDNYVSLSSILLKDGACLNNNGELTSQPDPNFRCVHQNLTFQTDLGYPVYTTPVRANSGGSIYTMLNQLEGLQGSSGDSLPPTLQNRLSKVPSPLFRDLNFILGLRNPSEVDQQMELQIQRGFETTFSKETSETKEYSEDFKLGLQIATSASLFGAKFDITASVEKTFGSKFTSSSVVSSSEVITSIQTSTVTIMVPAKSEASLSQLIIVDSPLGTSASSNTLFSSYFSLDITAIDGGSSPDNTTTIGTNNSTETNVFLAEVRAIRMGVANTSVVSNEIKAIQSQVLEAQSQTNSLSNEIKGIIQSQVLDAQGQTNMLSNEIKGILQSQVSDSEDQTTLLSNEIKGIQSQVLGSHNQTNLQLEVILELLDNIRRSLHPSKASKKAKGKGKGGGKKRQ